MARLMHMVPEMRKVDHAWWSGFERSVIEMLRKDETFKGTTVYSVDVWEYDA